MTQSGHSRVCQHKAIHNQNIEGNSSMKIRSLFVSISILFFVSGCTPEAGVGTANTAASATNQSPSNGFVAGYPTNETAQALFDEFDYQAAVQAYVWATPMLNTMGVWEAFRRDLGVEPGEMATAIINPQRPHQTMMTANDEVVYIISNIVNTAAAGPVVVEIPPGGLGLSVDFWMRPLQDFGNLGPDGGAGGKYLFLPVGYDEEIPEGYFPVQMQYSDHFFFISRTFPNDPDTGGIEGAVRQAKEVKMYPLSEADNPRETRTVVVDDGPFDNDWPKDERAFEWLSKAINADRAPITGLSTLGNLRRLGIEKGKDFAPDERAQAILKRAANDGFDIVRAMAFNNRFDGARIYADRQWEKIIHSRNPYFLPGSENGAPIYEEVEERAAGWYQLVGNSSNVTPSEPGTGVFYTTTYKDAAGQMLDGGKQYKLTMPADVPVRQFWQIPVYSNKTRSLINAEQKRPTRASTDNLVIKDDGSVDVYFGPSAPDGLESNWIQTIPGDGWFVLLRLYGPLEPILSLDWMPNDIEEIN
jgi:hypothetical protein